MGSLAVSWHPKILKLRLYGFRRVQREIRAGEALRFLIVDDDGSVAEEAGGAFGGGEVQIEVTIRLRQLESAWVRIGPGLTKLGMALR